MTPKDEEETGTELIRVKPGELRVMKDEAFMPIMSPERAVQRYNELLEFTQKIMRPGKDYGIVPGTDKPTLLKPGAEKLCSFFGLTPVYSIVEKVVNWGDEYTGEGAFFYFHYKCRLYRGDPDKDGMLVGEGEGSCNSRESKYRYRWVQESEVPDGIKKEKLKKRGGRVFEPSFAIKNGETSGRYGKSAEYWQRFRDAIADGSALKTTQERGKEGKIFDGYEIDSIVYRVPNPDIADQVNTIQKIGMKRAQVASTLTTCNASEYYTQDLEDMEAIDISSQVTERPTAPAGPDAGSHHEADHQRDQKLSSGRRTNPNDSRPPEQQVWVHDSRGERGTVPISRLDQYREDGYTVDADQGPLRNGQVPATEPPRAHQDQPTVAEPSPDADIQAFRARIKPKDAASRDAVFAELKRDMLDTLGLDAGTQEYEEILRRHNASQPKDLGSLETARKAAVEMFLRLRDGVTVEAGK